MSRPVKKQSSFGRFFSNVRSLFVAPISSNPGVFSDPNMIDYGVTVTNDAALRFTAVFAAIKILSENIASLPKTVLKGTEAGQQEDHKHPAFAILEKPNNYTDAFSFWFSMLCDLLGKGESFAVIKYEGSRPVALHRVDPDVVTVSFDNGEKVYKVNNPSPHQDWLNGVYMDHEMIHLMYFTRTGLRGVDPISYNASAIGRGIATQKFSADFYKRGGQIKGTLETDQALGDDAYENFINHYGKAAQNFETPLLEYGIKYKSIGITPIAAQLIQSETLSIQDIARIFSVPPHLLAEMSHATFSNIEAQNIYFAAYSLRPLCKRIEQQLEAKLLLDRERGEYSIKFDLRGMMRGDDAARSSYYKQAIEAGWMTPNEARRLEGMCRLDGLDAARLPLNTALVDEDGQIINPNAQKTE